MSCPECQSSDCRVITSRQVINLQGSRCRWRHCNACRHRWFTLQAPEVAIPYETVRWSGADVIVDPEALPRENEA